MSEASRPLLVEDRIRLYLTLVPYILERQPVELSAAAKEFGVAEKQMRKMVESLTLIGHPDQMPNELFDINWDLLDQEDIIEITNAVSLERVPKFTTREASALLAGLQFVASVPGVAEAGVVEALIQKLSRGAAPDRADLIVGTSVPDQMREVITTALKQQVAIKFEYQALDAGTTTSRVVDPVRIRNADAEWYLQGWCHLRGAMRTFHLERVRDPELTDIPNTHAHEAAPPLFQGDEDGEHVELSMTKAISQVIGDNLGAAELLESGGEVIARLKVLDARTLKRLGTRFGGELKILSPPHGRDAAREWALAGLALYNQ